MAEQLKEQCVPRVTCPECGTEIFQRQPSTLVTSQYRDMEMETEGLAALSVPSSASAMSSLPFHYSSAARALLKRTDCYTQENLTAFVAARYPEIPDINRQVLIIGAVTGAQTAAQLHVLLEGAKTGRDAANRITTHGAQQSLSY